ncbi:Xaa-Pro peptidase family protein [Rhizobiaceae bacterium n13]|uniref:Xaa-Pro peptidase family protein n=1 Tax=Ferirhizobium litorale TaxID=2927786 RepID=A0AAE3QBX8_9HYPH|nr:Xaa-Pro peptidase family protein [Fererhizobium litorale]MDI7861652.1 Xaa-Pro peptidase family protein [Fererhizobium litorale]MDI7922006.1 Xaa-Pro peptidase family protein [Fererhizobium litorale]
MNINANDTTSSMTPFDQARLDELMEAAGIDVIVATSKHNTQFLLGGYKFIFFAAMDAIGHSRYLPVVIYERGVPDHAGYIGNRMEGGEHQNHPFWTPSVHAACWGTLDAAALAVEHLKKIHKQGARIGLEPSFLPVDAYALIKDALPDAIFADATGLMERMRAIKTPDELEKLRRASELITDSMLATIASAQEGSTKAEIIEQLRREETNRGLHFEYCLLTLGASHNRASSSQAWRTGEVLSIDSGGNYHGYIGDLCRMGVLGEPDGELQNLLAEVDAIQHAAFSRVRAGVAGADVIAAAQDVLKVSPSASFTDFFAHGMGLISHEAPFLMTNHPVTYEGVDASRPLETGMVLSVETTMLHPTRGFIKLEDTLAVTAEGYEMFGDRGRGWNRGNG